MHDAYEAHKDVFISNWSGKHGHSSVVIYMAFSMNSKFLVTVSENQVKCW